MTAFQMNTHTYTHTRTHLFKKHNQHEIYGAGCRLLELLWRKLNRLRKRVIA